MKNDRGICGQPLFLKKSNELVLEARKKPSSLWKGGKPKSIRHGNYTRSVKELANFCGGSTKKPVVVACDKGDRHQTKEPAEPPPQTTAKGTKTFLSRWGGHDFGSPQTTEEGKNV